MKTIGVQVATVKTQSQPTFQNESFCNTRKTGVKTPQTDTLRPFSILHQGVKTRLLSNINMPPKQKEDIFFAILDYSVFNF